jgi:hypothetical protein
VFLNTWARCNSNKIVYVEFYVEESLGAMLMAKEVDKLYVSLKPPLGLRRTRVGICGWHNVLKLLPSSFTYKIIVYVRWKIEGNLFTITPKIAPTILNVSKIPIVKYQGSQSLSMKFTTEQNVFTPVRNNYRQKITTLLHNLPRPAIQNVFWPSILVWKIWPSDRFTTLNTTTMDSPLQIMQCIILKYKEHNPPRTFDMLHHSSRKAKYYHNIQLWH